VEQVKTTAKNGLNQIRSDRALPIIEQYQWLTAGTAFVNPVASLDLLATAVINGQMVLDLSQIYQQKLSLAQAQTVAVTLGELMLKLGLVELSSQAIAALLKTQPLTYLAGGALQGVSAAYLTRIAGLSLIEYLQEQEASLSDVKGVNQERLSQKLQQIFEQTQRFNGLQNLVQQAFSQFKNPAKDQTVLEV
ncbi:MAG: YcjF family protein, partial [Microcystaceae cyanobacterium]